jgi:hypothetical protein
MASAGERAVRNDVQTVAVPALTGERRPLAIEMNRA